jgi:endonuclease I
VHAALAAGATPRSDMHALMPSRAALNSARSNRAFAQIMSDDATGQGSSSP